MIRMSSRRRRLLVSCVLSTLAVAIGIAALHTPWARARVLAAVLARFAPDGSVQADRLDYRLPTLWFRLYGVRLLTPGAEHPYLTAEELTVDLPWSSAWRGLRLQQLELQQPRFSVVVAADGTSNFQGDGMQVATPVPIDRLQVSELQIEWRDAARGLQLDAGDIQLDLGNEVERRLGMSDPATLRIDGRQATIELAGGLLGWNGRDLRLEDLRFDSAAAHLEIGGTIDRLLADRGLGLEFQLLTPLSTLATLGGFDIVGGALSAAGQVSGTAAAPTAELALEIESAASRRVTLQRVHGNIQADRQTIRLSDLRAELGEGEITGNLDISLEADAASRLAMGWTGIDPELLLSAAPSALSITTATRLAGQVHAEWPGPTPSAEALTARFTTRFIETPSSPSAIALDGRIEAELADGIWSANGSVDAASGLHLAADLAGALENGTLGGTTLVTVDDIGAVAQRLVDLAPGLLGPLAEVAGQATADLAVSGSLPEPRISGEARVEHIRGDGTGSVTATSHLAAGTESISLRGASLRFPGGSVTADLELGAGGAVEGRIRGTVTELDAALSLARLSAGPPGADGVSGAVDWDMRIEGTLARPAIAGTLAARTVRIADSAPIDVQARLSPSPYGIRVDQLNAISGGNRVEVKGVIGARGEHLDLLAEIDLAAPAELGDRSELGYVKSARAEVALGIDRTTSTVVLDLWSLQVDLPRFPISSAVPGRVTWSPTEVAVEDLALRVGDLDLAISGILGIEATLPGIHGELRGDLSRLSDLAAMALDLAGDASESRQVVLSGGLDATLGVGGTLADPLPRGSVRIIDGTAQIDDTTLEALVLQASVDSDRLQVQQIGGRWKGAELEASAEIPLALIIGADVPPAGDVARLQARFGPVGTAVLRSLIGREAPAGFDGEATLSIQATTPTLELTGVRADLQLDSLALNSNGITVSQQRPTRLRLENGSLSVVDWMWTRPGWDDISLSVAGDIELVNRHQLDLRLDSQLQLPWLAPLIGAGALRGAASATVGVTGTVAEPTFDGRIELADVGFAVADPQLVVSDVDGTLTIADRMVHTDGLEGIVNGGQAMLLLDLDLTEPMSPVGLAGLTVRSIVVEGGGGRALSDADVTVRAGPQGDLQAFGEVRLLAGGYRSDASLAGDLLEASAAAQAPTSATPTLFDDLSYDIHVSTVNDLRIDAPYAELRMATDLQIVGTFARPGVVGRMTVRDGGVVRLAGNAYSIDRGVIEFDETSSIAPTLDIAARAEIGGEQISLLLTGSAFNPSVEANAESGLDSADVLSLMATGRTMAAAGEAGLQVLAEQAFDMLTGQVLAGAVRRLGFESVRFERGGTPAAAQSELFPRDTDLASRLTLTRGIRNTFDLVFSQNLTNADERSWIGTLRLPLGLALRGGTFDDGTRSIELQHRLVVGDDAGDAGGIALRTAPRVRSVRFEGGIGYSVDAIKQQLRVGVGDRFDFLRWQEDRDRLARLYHRRGFLEADIVARRSPPADTDPSEVTGVDLTYIIDRGPETVLTVDGELPSRVRQELLEAWGDSVLTEFLLEDMRQIALGYLADRGHVRPAVAVELVSDTGRKEIVLRLDPGERYRRAASTIVGNAALDSETIRRRIAERGLEAADWTHQEELETAVRELYAERGWLDARVEATGAEIDGDAARVSILIEEGHRYQLGLVGIIGNTSLDEAALRKQLGLQTNGPYHRDELAAAGDAVLESYLRRGQNGTTVRVTTEAHADTLRIDVMIRIDEAPQQILADVHIVGLKRVRRSVVEGAVGARPGSPMLLSDVQAARRRLYATGVLERIKLDVQPIGDPTDGRQPVVLRVEVDEQPPLRLRYGVQLLSDETLEDQRETRPGVAATVSHSALLGLPAELSATARYRGKESLVRGVLGFRGLFGAPVRTALIAERSRDEVEGFFTTTINDTRFTLEQRLDLSSSVTVGYSYNLKHARSTLIGADFQLEPVTSARLVPTLIHDRRDDRLDPSRGVFQSATLEVATGDLGSELLFRKLHLKQYAFFSLGRVTFASAIRFGSGVSLDPTSTQLPRSERFVAGGATSLRGYPDDSVGGTEFFGSFVPGGNAVLVLNQEARFPIWRWIRGVGFLDAGSAFATVSDLRLGRLKLSAGLGLRLVTPYLTLRLDYGVRLSDLAYLPDAPGGRFHFGIGHIF
ncbi:MAG TPA: translocation/assembly module TamB domain-containing protein [Acidobacteriota bacterium]|nr:translocation/assembly module TamB domain-containing protein [Acidobacteriota bacterium]